MLGDISVATNIFIVTGYTDMRKSIDGLCAIVYDQITSEPPGHSVYLFCGKCCAHLQVLFHESDGYVPFVQKTRCLLFKENTAGLVINQKSEVSPVSNLTG